MINYLFGAAIAIIAYFLRQHMDNVKQMNKELQEVKSDARTNEQLIKSETRSIYRHFDTGMTSLKEFVQQQNENVMKHIDTLHNEIKNKA